MRHVRSHIAVPGNELADWLAEMGRHGGAREEVGVVAAGRWLRQWMAGVARRAGRGAARPASDHTHAHAATIPNTLGDPVGVG